jgi:fructokinase
MEKLLGSIEAGGTKFVLAVADFDFNIKEKFSIPTTTPEETLAKTIEFFQKFDLAAIGIGSFGPIDVNKNSTTYGHILATPKLRWAGFDFLGTLKSAFDVPMTFTTDVNSSAYGEYIQDDTITSIVYITVGTGIGGGAIQNCKFIGGISHSEIGHIPVHKHKADANFKGVCPFHGDCLEGLAAGPSLEARTGIRGENIPADSDVWDIQAYYIAQVAYVVTLDLAPQKIILGGGVFSQPHMIERVRKHFTSINNGYVVTPKLDDYLLLPSIANNGSATVGNFALAHQAL